MTPVQRRLTEYRRKAAESKCEPAQNWRYWRPGRETRKSIIGAPGTNVDYSTYRELGYMYGAAFTESVDSIGSYLGDVYELCRQEWYRNRYGRGIDHTGWYTDSFQDGLCRGGVSKLRTPKGTLYIPVTHTTDSDGAIHYMADAHLVPKGSDEDSHREAIHESLMRADCCAELYAEEAREHDAKFQAESQIESLQEEIESEKELIRSIRQEMRENRTVSAPTLCATLRGRIRQAIHGIREARERIEKLTDNYWHAVEY